MYARHVNKKRRSWCVSVYCGLGRGYVLAQSESRRYVGKTILCQLKRVDKKIDAFIPRKLRRAFAGVSRAHSYISCRFGRRPDDYRKARRHVCIGFRHACDKLLNVRLLILGENKMLRNPHCRDNFSVFVLAPLTYRIS